MREDGCVMPQHQMHGVEPSLSRAAPPALNGTVARPEQEREHASALPTHFDEAQAEQALWQEFREHDASLNNTLNEALRIHGGPAWRIFQVRVFLLNFGVSSPLVSSVFVLLLTQFLSCLVRR
jgi:hypothetical protein